MAIADETIMGAQNINLRDQPAYGVAEAARYLKLPAATLRSWVVGRAYPSGESVATFRPLILESRLFHRPQSWQTICFALSRYAYSQFSVRTPGYFAKSFRLFVTSITLSETACAAINLSR